MLTETTSVRAGEEIDADALSAYLAGRIEGVEHGIVIQQFQRRPFPDAHLPFARIVTAAKWCCGAAPLGPVAPKAHDMVREARVLEAVHPHFRPAPEVYLICEDASIIGAPFFLMERRRGIVLRDQIPAGDRGPSQLCQAASAAPIVRLPGGDCTRSTSRRPESFIALGKPDGFVARQVKGWSER